MTNSERAEKIWDDLENRRMGVRIKGIWVARLTQELDEAVREAQLHERQKFPCCCEADRPCECRSEGFASAREKAAGIVRLYDFEGPDKIVTEGRKTLTRILNEILGMENK